MITLPELLGELARSGRWLERRTARDWWARGLLPRPGIVSLGRGRGTQTVWHGGRVIERAMLAIDLRKMGVRPAGIVVALWLCGHAVDPATLRKAWIASLDVKRPRAFFAARRGLPSDEKPLADAAALARASGAPRPVAEAIEACVAAVLGDHWGVSAPDEGEALGAVFTAALKFWRERNQIGPAVDVAIDDATADGLRGFLARFSRPAVSALVSTGSPDAVSDVELLRARRALLLVAGGGLRGPDGLPAAEWVRLCLPFAVTAVPALAAHLRRPEGRLLLADLLAAGPGLHWRRVRTGPDVARKRTASRVRGVGARVGGG